jgi:hypothetical protein
VNILISSPSNTYINSLQQFIKRPQIIKLNPIQSGWLEVSGRPKYCQALGWKSFYQQDKRIHFLCLEFLLGDRLGHLMLIVREREESDEPRRSVLIHEWWGQAE